MFCRKLPEKQRIILVATASVLFALGCLYAVFSSLSDFGHSGDGLEIEHIRPLEPEKPGIPVNHENNHFKDYYDDGHSENQDTARIES
ncbi:hypothetical protein JCM10512_3273 [Bacteroides reticulotermitis JCM 10512]|uniref:DUF3989 domain-containing protein n=2 Tax=Bacteroides reticulotermitis TaxID=1133319 RepID=W4UVC3_9BACE|nr:hypothetical protein JCM10512_3273 [Bacteroides reticulotermitis JCM 10512]